MKNDFFYVKVIKCSIWSLWYNDCIGHLFLIRRSLCTESEYALADGCSWIKKADAKKMKYPPVVS